MYRTKVVCFGEALIDRIRNKSNAGFTDFLGGAPANVVCALKKLKIDSVFIGCLGSDEFGKKFLEKFDELKINVDFLQWENNFPTRIVKVDRDNSGDRFFSGFDVENQKVFADEVINKSLLKADLLCLEKIFLEAEYFVTGTNSLSSQMSADSLYFLISLANKFDLKIIIDLNWREVFWNYSTFTSHISKKHRVNLIKNLLNYAHLLKLSKEEAIWFFDNENPREISEKLLTCPDVIITDGSEPISWFINGLYGITKVNNSSKIIDTTGAGDAFLAGFISKLISSGYPLKDLEIQNYIKFASVCGLLTCLGEGAIEQQPNYASVNKFLGSQIL